MYQREAAKIIREAESLLPLAVLTDRTLIEMWGMYSCETQRRFWIACDSGEVGHFVVWAQRSRTVAQVIEKAQRAERMRLENRAAARLARPSPHFVLGWESHHTQETVSHPGGARLTEARKVPLEKLMTVHELVDSVNHWCAEHHVIPSIPGTKVLVNEQMVRYCCDYSLLDRPGCPSDGRRKGFSQKHACQLRAIRLLQARSLSLTVINSILHGRSLQQLRQLEHEELCLLKGVNPAGAKEEKTRRPGSPSWA